MIDVSFQSMQSITPNVSISDLFVSTNYVATVCGTCDQGAIYIYTKNNLAQIAMVNGVDLGLTISTTLNTAIIIEK